MNIEQLKRKIIDCRKCDRLVQFREKIALEKRKAYSNWEYWGRPVPGFGSKNAKIMVLGLAPAAHGGNRTGRVFTGDRSADFLFRCLYHVGLSNQASSEHRNDGLELEGFITTAVKCVPPGDKPTPKEKENCEVFLNKEFEMLKNIKVILGLGKIGFDSYLKYLRKKYPIKMKDYKFGHGVRYEMPNKLILFGAFHPSPRNVNTGKLNFEMMVEFLKRIKSELK